jgi:glycerol-3-phosphate dehydrogenase
MPIYGRSTASPPGDLVGSSAMAARPFVRDSMLDALREAGSPDGVPFDVVVIGGGITGVGVALDAVTRGLRTALVERDDFASGTSSKSSKMVHGGLRYLQNGDVRLVYEALRERRRLMRNAPHLVEVLPFMIPILTKDGVVSKKVAKALGSAMWMYDLTGGWRIGKLHRRVGAEQAARHFPTTHLDKLSAGYVYYDAAADDARLTLAVARTAAEHGAVMVNRCRVVDVILDESGKASGVTVDADGERIGVPARCVVNAAGVWADEVRALDEGRDPGSIRPAKGVHVTIPWAKVRNDIAVIIPVRSDRRSLFLVPWGERPDGTFRHCYVGTTDTDDDCPLDDPQCTTVDVDYILTALNEALTETITRDDITGVWAGLRPLVKAVSTDRASEKTADLSRQHQVAVSDAGVVRVNGGKLTTFREMAEDTVDVVVDRLRAPRRARRSRTRRLALSGAVRRSEPRGSLAAHLLRRHGSRADEVRALIAFDPELGEPLVEGQPYLRAEAVYAARHEMVTTLDDVLLRRTRAHLFDRDATLAAAPSVAALIAPELGWDDAEVERQLERYRQICRAEEAAADTRTGTVDAGLTNAAD